MTTMTNLLMSKERKGPQVLDTECQLLDRNLELIYKQNKELAEESIQHVMSVSNLEEVKQLYYTGLHTSGFKMKVFEHLKCTIASQQVKPDQINDNIMFHTFALKITAYFSQLLPFSRINEQRLENVTHIQSRIMEQLEKSILKISYRTLVLDMNINREQGKLLGTTPEQQYEYYHHHCLQDKAYMEKFFEKYPVLLRALGGEIRKYRKFLNELFARFERDYDQIAALFAVSKAVQIRDIEMGIGDSHSDGRKVTRLVLNCGQLIYKPRSLSIDKLYEKIIHFTNEMSNAPDLQLQAPGVLERKHYGWAEYISFQGCANQQQVQQFYTRMGAQMALLYTLQAVDFHSENLIAHGDQPVLIDLESLFHPMYERDQEEATAYQQAEKKLNESVRALGLLPFLFAGKADISGIGRQGKTQSILKVPQLKHAKTAYMQVQREYTETDESYNQPLLENTLAINPKQYVKELKQGFGMMYELLFRNKQALCQLLEDHGAAAIIRFIPKPTVKYASLLELSFHPRFLHNSIDREVFLSKIWEDSKGKADYEKLVIHEFVDLLNNDIPYFSIHLNQRHLYTAKRKEIGDFFRESPLEMVQRRISGLSMEDKDFQLQIIELSMLAAEEQKQTVLKQFVSKEYSDYTQEPAAGYKALLQEKAIRLTEYIHAGAYHSCISDKPTYAWLNTMPVGVEELQWNLSVMGDSLYDGLSGMALLNLSLWKAGEGLEYRQRAEHIMDDVIERYSNLEINADNRERISIGAYSGIASIVYTLLNFYRMTGKRHFYEGAGTVASLIPKLLPYDRELDLIGGSSGALAVMARGYEIEQDPLFHDLAEGCVKHLLDSAIYIDDQQVTWKGIAGKPLTGFSHGNAGMIYALQLWERYTDNKELKTIIKKGLNFENNQSSHGNWNDLRKPVQEAATSAWCHGSPGILMSRLELANSSDSEVALQAVHDQQMALPNILHDGFGREQSLCHGDMGNGMILMQYGRKTNRPAWLNVGKNLIIESATSRLKYQCGVGNEVETPNMMLGLAGIAYGMLYACHPELPNILDLELSHTPLSE
ncbi:type 2 lanthipeptide synthetase LanM family protein [Paenibacillus wulumuqiensis]|uniref:type 2 lanthipeptide synthetase LanM family protein n=1 Tax=Paenibacillus wulumuqiensis TaxID=1567107 RepID=UPI000619D9CC|nr:type 2 lanthipeptide synthetase LanM family protein [Paenibacillus wulumuqiensis]